MEQTLICRTCLKNNLSRISCVSIYDKSESNQMVIKDMLEIFMPEMDLDISEGDAVMCIPCIEALKNAYTFKNICLKTEEKIYDYLHQHNIQLGLKISLDNIIQQTVQESSLTFKNETNSENHTYSYESNSEEVKPQTRKRKRTKKLKYDYNSLKRSYTCDLCEYKAYRLDLLDTHKQKHDRNMLNIKEYKCEFCLYSTPRKRALDRHLFTHKGKSEHLCKICNKTFAEKYQLKLHSITHTGQELPHKCEDCGKGYLTKSYLKQHMETRHLAKNNEKCGDCDDSDKCGHLYTRNYKCNICEASFSDRRGLDAHKFTHTGGELPYKCLHCSFSTAWKGNLKKHLQNKH